MRFRRRTLKASGFSFIDDIASSLRGYALLREEDNVLILPPNRVFKVNATGFLILKALMSGIKARRLHINDGKMRDDVLSFIDAVRKAAEGRSVFSGPGTGLAPYNFAYTSLPVLGEIAVTNRCNNRCGLCYLPAGSNAQEEMSFGQIKKIIDIFHKEAKIPFFSFTGGEPLMREDLEKCIRYAVKLGLATNLITNGTLADTARARSLAKQGLRTAQVSVEAADESKHDALTRVPGAFTKTLHGIEALIKAGISVQTNTTITRLNAETAALIPHLIHSLGIRKFSMNLFIPAGEGMRNSDLFFPYGKVGAIIEDVRRKARELGLTFFWYSPIPHCLYNPLARGLGNKSCAAMDGLISVSPLGDVLPCSSYPEPIGNLLSQSFSDVWFSKRALFFKKKRYAPSICAGCDKFIACQGACPLYWRFAGTDELVSCNTPEGGNAL